MLCLNFTHFLHYIFFKFSVDDFRSNALSLLESHFTQDFQSKNLNRVEFLPVVWTQALNEGASGLKE